MTVRTPKRLAGPAQLGNSAATVYTVPASTTTVLRQIHIQNPSGGAVTFTLSVGNDAAGTRLYYVKSVAAGAAVDFWEYIPLEAGEVIQAYASSAATLVMTLGGDELTTSLADGFPRVYSKSFAYNTTDLSNGTGVVVYTPTVGELLLDAWFEITTAWNGTLPHGDIGTGVGATGGLWEQSLQVSMLDADQAGTVAGNGGYGGTGILMGNNTGNTVSLAEAAADLGSRISPIKFTAAHPLRVWVTQSGEINGADPGASQGAAILYLMIAQAVAL